MIKALGASSAPPALDCCFDQQPVNDVLTVPVAPLYTAPHVAFPPLVGWNVTAFGFVVSMLNPAVSVSAEMMPA